MARFVGGGGRDDSFVGTDESDLFVFDTADLTAGDTIAGGAGAGFDTLQFTTAGTISGAALTNVRGIERIELSDAGNSIALTQPVLASAAGAALSVVGGAGDDVIDASAMREADGAAGTLVMLGGDGSDYIVGVGGGSDGFHNVYQTADGGAGADTIDLSQASFRTYVTYDPNDLRVATNYGTLYVNGRAVIDTTQTSDQSFGDTNVLTGIVDVDASASSKSVRLIGGGLSYLTGGSGKDVLVNGIRMIGGDGADTFIGTLGFASVVLKEGDFAPGERILMNAGLATLDVVGSVDFREGKVVGVDRLYIEATKPDDMVVVTMGLETGRDLEDIYVYSGKARVELILEGNQDFVKPVFNAQVALDVRGSDGANTIEVNSNATQLFGGDGDDTLVTRGKAFGQAGDDAIAYYSSRFSTSVALNGGRGSDTLVWDPDASIYDRVTIDLSKKDQSIDDGADIRGFENVDFSLSRIATLAATGDASDNVLVGSWGNDILNGREGDDVLNGYRGVDKLVGGKGADTFQWTVRESGNADEIDFRVGEDHLAFDRKAFDVAGNRFDKLIIVEGGARPSIAGVDVIILNSSSSAQSFLEHAHGGRVGEGVFVVASGGDGTATLYHAIDASFTQSQDLVQIATFRLADVTDLTLASFGFV